MHHVMSKKIVISLSAIAMALSVAGCTNQELSRAQKGLLAGAGVGAAVGGLIGSKKGKTGKGAAIGGAVGAIAGGVIGQYMDKQAKELETVADTQRVDDGVVVTMKDKILFDVGKADLKAESRASLDKIAGVLKKYEKTDLTVAGHTDSTGTASLNKDLSDRRAMSVRSYLVEKGVPSSRLETVGFGPDKPITSNDTAEGRAQNRRVEIHIAPNDQLINEAQQKQG